MINPAQSTDHRGSAPAVPPHTPPSKSQKQPTSSSEPRPDDDDVASPAGEGNPGISDATPVADRHGHVGRRAACRRHPLRRERDRPGRRERRSPRAPGQGRRRHPGRASHDRPESRVGELRRGHVLRDRDPDRRGQAGREGQDDRQSVPIRVCDGARLRAQGPGRPAGPRRHGQAEVPGHGSAAPSSPARAPTTTSRPCSPTAGPCDRFSATAPTGDAPEQLRNHFTVAVGWTHERFDRALAVLGEGSP